MFLKVFYCELDFKFDIFIRQADLKSLVKHAAKMCLGSKTIKEPLCLYGTAHNKTNLVLY